MTIDHLEFSKKPYDDYIEQLNRECASHTALPEISYRYETEQKTQTLAEKIFSYLYSIVTYPYQLLRWLAGKIIVPASWYYPLSACTQYRGQQDINAKEKATFMQNMYRAKKSTADPLFKYKRVSIAVDDMVIDAMLIVRNSTAENGKWILSSNGNAEIYEMHKAYFTSVKQLAFSLNANALVFNYPGVGASKGSLSPETLAKTYKAMLRFLENKEKGIGAETIIGYGLSLGGAVQAIGLESHELGLDINYTFVKDRTFSTLSKAATGIVGLLAGKLVEFLNWGMDTAACSKKLKAHEIILQSTETGEYGETRVRDDGIISAQASLAKGFTQEDFADFKNIKTFIPLQNKGHNDPFTLDELLSLIKEIESSVEKQILARATVQAAQEQAG